MGKLEGKFVGRMWIVDCALSGLRAADLRAWAGSGPVSGSAGACPAFGRTLVGLVEVGAASLGKSRTYYRFFF